MTPKEIELIVSATLTKLGVLKPYLSQAEAYRMYGRVKVERWVREGLLKPAVSDGDPNRTDMTRHSRSKKRFLRTDLEAVAAGNHVLTKYLAPKYR